MSERNSKVANSLVAMSSAAVLAVYGAGYARTQAAAEKLESQSDERRPAGPGRGRGSAPAAVAREEAAPVAGAADPAVPAQRGSEVVVARAETPNPAVDAAAKSLMPSASTAVSTPAAIPTVAPSGTPAAAAETAPAPAPVVEHKPEPVVAVAAPPPPPPPPPPPAPKWKDGTYTGWGTSRHGDIQAQVIIEDGRIKSASIAQCYTRYSCDVIDKIIPQVAQRQSPETDYVSGATQSTNAFYYGVVDALSKAK